METVRKCGCKGIRTCLICETEFNICKPDLFKELQELPSYVYCPPCDKAYPGWDMNIFKDHPHHQGTPISYPGVFIKLDFLTTREGEQLLIDVDNLPWDISQSGRRKQNYGPKCNFKKKKLRLGDFNGFPRTTKFIQEKFDDIPLLKGFRTIEQCSLEYTKERGASIDPHIDDCWIWGERIVTVNVFGDSTLTMTRFHGDERKYNRHLTSTYPPVIDKNYSEDENVGDFVVRLPMPERSLMVLYGPARYDWDHLVFREDIESRRVCIAYREFTPPYLPGGDHSHQAIEVLTKAENFW
ncbi:alpha-ketoglutarate-dependent dioxygenase alkB homolog 4 isoform X1 [Diachasmimorpha longicaudata]|uniref:alpha-ketoglutarate-dependent dioxygenase alkB homolog 4 isoform X1 n=2 Tax=Diachasmimorpha longicaudata TaxID=58733 RepID=UPI0030B8F987